MEKVAPSERFRHELDEVLAGVGEEQDPIGVVGRIGARLILRVGVRLLPARHRPALSACC
jgi:hypothetical protein